MFFILFLFAYRNWPSKEPPCVRCYTVYQHSELDTTNCTNRWLHSDLSGCRRHQQGYGNFLILHVTNFPNSKHKLASGLSRSVPISEIMCTTLEFNWGRGVIRNWIFHLNYSFWCLTEWHIPLQLPLGGKVWGDASFIQLEHSHSNWGQWCAFRLSFLISFYVAKGSLIMGYLIQVSAWSLFPAVPRVVLRCIMGKLSISSNSSSRVRELLACLQICRQPCDNVLPLTSIFFACIRLTSKREVKSA